MFANEISIYPQSFNSDASMRLRVSQMNILGQYKFLNDKLPLLFSEAGTGSVTFSDSQVTQSVTAGQYSIRQTKKFHPYFNGQSQLIEMTMSSFGNQANVVKRLGYFSSNAVAPYNANYDGIYLENDGVNVSLKIDRNGANISSQPQSSWLDPLDGTGLSGMNINWNNFNVFAFDFLYLGGTALRLFVMYQGRFWLVAVYYHAGTLSNTMIKTPNQPLRSEIRSTTGVGSLTVYCMSVASEGGLNQLGISRAINNGNSGVSFNTIGVNYLCKAIRKKVGYRDIQIENIIGSVLFNSTDIVRWSLILNPTVAGALVYSDVANSSVQEATGSSANTVTGGTVIYESFGSVNSISESSVILNQLSLGCDLNNNMDVIALVVTPLSANISVYGIINYKEIL